MESATPRNPPNSPKFKLKKSRSQHFLADALVLKSEARLLQAKGKAVLEIGAGDGRLSEQVLAQAPKKLTLVEYDSQWAEYLREKFKANGQVEILHKDFLELPDNFPATHIIGNIPYQITSDIILKLGRMKFMRAVICVQKEVAARLMAEAGSSEYGRMSVFAQTRFHVEYFGSIPRTSFTPPPKVDSSIIILTPNPMAKTLPAHLDVVTAALFSHRLKNVSGSIFHSRHIWGWSKEEARKIAQNLYMADARVFELEPAQVVTLAKSLPAQKSKSD